MTEQGRQIETTTRTMLPPWMVMMQAAARKLLSEADVEAIIQVQIDAAKKGDQKAARFVFEQLMGGAAMKGATFVQHVYPEGQRSLPAAVDAVETPASLARPAAAVEPPEYECADCGHDVGPLTKKDLREFICTKCGCNSALAKPARKAVQP